MDLIEHSRLKPLCRLPPAMIGWHATWVTNRQGQVYNFNRGSLRQTESWLDIGRK